MSLTTDPNDPCLQNGKKEEGQNSCYLVLSHEERAKGFVRPYRDTYVHRGKEVPKLENGITLHDLSVEDKVKEYNAGYVAKLVYSEEWRAKNNSSLCSQLIDQKEYDAIQRGDKYIGGCGTSTKMGSAIAETYARDPSFYGATFCCQCNRHIRLEEFVWEGTQEIVGS